MTTSANKQYLDNVFCRTLVVREENQKVTTVTAAKTLITEDSGKVVILKLAAGFTLTLPALASGLSFEVVIGTAPSGGNYVVTSGAANIHCIVTSSDLNGATDAGHTAGTAVTNVNFIDAKAAIGDRVKLVCDGTNWYAHAQTIVFDGITLT